MAVAGLGRSGLACANLLYDLGADVWVTEQKDSADTRLNAAKLKSQNIKVELGRHTQAFIKDKGLLVISPGLTDTSLPLRWALASGVAVISEIELAAFLCPAAIIATTGSNGKTTVTTLIARILEKAGKKVFLCGNIGNPFAGEVERIQEGDFVSLEASSFQLERIKAFKPKVAVMLNIAPNHLDRYAAMQEYIRAKKRLFMNQDASDFLVLNADDPLLKGLAEETKAKVVYFSRGPDLNPNQAALSAVGSVLGIPQELIRQALGEFNGIEHRMEFVARINDIKFINDSKATTVESALWALENIRGPVVLIAGGRHKGIDYSRLRQAGRDKIKEIILIGEAGKIIESALEGFFNLAEARTLEEAVAKAFKKACAGECVLLSPMCSSFDMFSSYEERGECFKKAVNQLAKKLNPNVKVQIDTY